MSGFCDDARITTFGLLLEAHAGLTAALGRNLETETGLPLTWFEVLLRLARSPEGHLRMCDLASQVALSTSGLTRVIDRMEKADLVTRQTCPSDRRVLHAVLSDAGAQALEMALPSHVAAIQKHLVDPLGEKGLAELADHLRTLRDSSDRESIASS